MTPVLEESDRILGALFSRLTSAPHDLRDRISHDLLDDLVGP